MDAAHRCARGWRVARVFEKHKVVVIIERLRARHFLEVVILRRQPEYRHRGQSLLAEPRREAHRREGFVESERGSGEQTHLLAGDDGEGFGRSQAANIFKRLLRTAESAILGFENFDQRAAVWVLGAHTFRRGLVGGEIERTVVVKFPHALEMA